jgi:hypothetical protein
LCPHSSCGRTFWPSALSYFTHFYAFMTALKLIVRTEYFGSLV